MTETPIYGRIYAVVDHADLTTSVTAAWSYNDGTTTETAYTLASGDRAAIETQLRAQVAGPNHEEDAITFSWPA